MKKIYIVPLLLFALLLGSCSEDKLSSKSVIVDPIVEQNEFDKWIFDKYINVYNIDVLYRMQDIESDMNYNLVPPRYDKSVILTQLVRYLCLEAYDETTGSTQFIKNNFPKILNLIGSPAYKNNGTMVIGTAEGGQKITLYNVNLLDLNDMAQMNDWFFHTIHHEFAHILHQKKPYSPAFEEISGADYITDNWNELSENKALQKGFISQYAASAVSEDFVELISLYITLSDEAWEEKLENAGENDPSTKKPFPGKAIILEKFEIVENYLLESWGIDIHELRDEIKARMDKMSEIDFTTLQ